MACWHRFPFFGVDQFFQFSSKEIEIVATAPPDVLFERKFPHVERCDSSLGSSGPKSRTLFAAKPRRPRERDAFLRSINIAYHVKRAELRRYQAEHSLGPLQVHTFYTMDCTHYSLWQVLALEYSWDKVGTGGFISRLVSGCAKTNRARASMSKTVLPDSVARSRFGSYFTPDFSTLPDTNGHVYLPYNRPNSIWYWLNHTDLTEDVFVLVDPDMVFLRAPTIPNVRRLAM